MPVHVFEFHSLDMHPRVVESLDVRALVVLLSSSAATWIPRARGGLSRVACAGAGSWQESLIAFGV